MALWIFIVDTEKYAGNFERDMCAFMTGIIGECEVGRELAHLYYEQTGLVEEGFDWSCTNVEWCEELKNPFTNLVIKKPDEHGCHRPTEMWTTPGWFNHGMGGNFREGQEEEAKKDYKRKCLEYAKTKVHPNDKAAHEARWESNSKKPLTKHPASLSVAIFFKERPTDKLINLMIERAKKYVEEYAPNQDKFMRDRLPDLITGFRLLKEETIQTKEQSWEA